MEKNSKRENNIKLSKLFLKCAFEDEWQTIKDVDYKFIEQGDILQIYFMGSYQVTDWIRNFLFKKKPYKDMAIPYRVHRGFLAAWKEVEDIIIAKIKEVKNPKAPSELQEPKWKHITVIGYSHGGALAGLCHECVWFWRPDLREDGLEGYGFEAPRFYGGWKVKKELKERWKTFHVIRDGSDIVTHCPPALFGFCHVGDIIKVKGDLELGPDKWYIPNCVQYHYPQVVYSGLFKKENN